MSDPALDPSATPAAPRPARLLFDRGTLLLHGLPAGVDPSSLEGVLWDERVQAWRAAAHRREALRAELAARGVSVAADAAPEAPRPDAWGAVPLRPYQVAALDAWSAAGRRGVVVLPTGAGKTQVAVAAIKASGRAALVLVPTRALLEQWAERIARDLHAPVGRLGDGAHDPRPVTVSTLESARRHLAWLGPRWDLLVVDEVHHVSGGATDEVLELSPAPLRLGLTATPPAPGPGLARLAALVGPVVFALGVTDLAGRWLAPFDLVSLELPLEPDERAEYERARQAYTAVARPFFAAAPGAAWSDFVRACARSDAGRRALVAWRRTRALLAFTRGKARALGELLARHRERRVLVFVADNRTAYAVARAHLVTPITCDVARAERREALARFARGELRALVSARVLDEGIDVPEADVGIVVGATQGARQHVQRIGRLLRPAPGKRALVYELVTPSSLEERDVARRRRGLEPDAR